jgi:KaiC/GvpD/RAD55 family RecA-like ATPase
MSSDEATANELKIESSSLAALLRGSLRLPNDPDTGLVILIEGKPGTGKSTLAIQLLDCLDPENCGRERLLYSIEQTQPDVTSKYLKMMSAKLVNLAPKAMDPAKENLIPAWCDDLAAFINCRQKKREARDLTDVSAKLANLALSSGTGPMSSSPQFAQLVGAMSPLLRKRLDIADLQQDDSDDSFLRNRSRIEEKLTSIVESLNRKDKKASCADSSGSKGAGSGLVTERNASPCQERAKRPLVVVDGLSLFLPTEQAAINFQRLVDVLRRTCAVGIMVYEPGSRDQSYLEHQVDLMIELRERWMEEPQTYLLHELCVRKSRYQDAALGLHQYKIRDYGLEVFPSVHFQVHQPNYMALEYARSLIKDSPSRDASADTSRPDKSTSIIDHICQIQPGDSTVLLGPRGSCKTELCLDFLCRGDWGHCMEEPKPDFDMGLLVSMIGNSHQTHGGLCCPFNGTARGKNCPVTHKPPPLPEHIYRFHQRPGFITPAEFLSCMTRRVLEKVNGDKSIARFVLWDLTQLDYRFPLFAQDTMLLTALIDFFKNQKVKSLFMGAGRGRHSDAASAMADNVLFCWRTTLRQPIKDNDRSCVLIYLDRIGDESKRPAKRLYAIPVKYGHVLRIDDPKQCVHPVPEDERATYLEEEDLKKIGLITNKQGFETARL